MVAFSFFILIKKDDVACGRTTSSFRLAKPHLAHGRLVCCLFFAWSRASRFKSLSFCSSNSTKRHTKSALFIYMFLLSQRFPLKRMFLLYSIFQYFTMKFKIFCYIIYFLVTVYSFKIICHVALAIVYFLSVFYFVATKFLKHLLGVLPLLLGYTKLLILLLVDLILALLLQMKLHIC